MPTNFEVHTLKSGVWQIDSTYQTREPAIETALATESEPAPAGSAETQAAAESVAAASAPADMPSEASEASGGDAPIEESPSP